MVTYLPNLKKFFGIIKVIMSKGPVGYDVELIAAVSVAISALTMMEGRYVSSSIALSAFLVVVLYKRCPCPSCCCSVWRNVRGAGLAYGASMDHDVFSGLLKLDIYRSSQPAAGTASFCEMIAIFHPLCAALAAVRTSINSFIHGDIDEQTITSARCR